MATPLFTPDEASSLKGRAFERVILEVLIRKSNLCDLHKIKLRGQLDSVEASAGLGVSLPGIVFDRIKGIDYNRGDQKAQDSTEAMYFIKMYQAFNTKLLQTEREAGTIHPTSAFGPSSLNLWHVLGGSRFTIEQFSAGRSMENFMRMHSTRCGFLANNPPHNDAVPQCTCPDGPRGEAAAGGVDETVMQAVVRGLAPEMWDAMAFQRRRNAVVHNFVNLTMVDFMALFNNARVKAALAGLEEQMVAPPAYPGHPGLQPGEVQEISRQISSRQVDRDWLLESLRSLLV